MAKKEKKDTNPYKTEAVWTSGNANAKFVEMAAKAKLLTLEAEVNNKLSVSAGTSVAFKLAACFDFFIGAKFSVSKCSNTSIALDADFNVKASEIKATAVKAELDGLKSELAGQRNQMATHLSHVTAVVNKMDASASAFTAHKAEIDGAVTTATAELAEAKALKSSIAATATEAEMTSAKAVVSAKKTALSNAMAVANNFTTATTMTGLSTSATTMAASTIII